MGSGRFLRVSCIVAALAICKPAFAAPPDAERHASTPASVPAGENAPVADAIECRSDKDCPVLACGPCTPGAPITKAMFPAPSCAMNPCLDASSVCNVGHRCEIGPGTKKNPRVWTKPKS